MFGYYEDDAYDLKTISQELLVKKQSECVHHTAHGGKTHLPKVTTRVFLSYRTVKTASIASNTIIISYYSY